MRVLQTALPQLLAHRSDAASWTIVFEYELPRERGHRPDVVILTGTAILVLEFKQLREAHRAHIDQVAAYARDLHAYHAGSHAHPVIPLLVPTSSPSPPGKSGPVYVVGPGSLARALAVLGAEGVSRPPLDPQQWLDSGYAPLPTLVEAAQTIFAHEPLPTIRRARSAGIPEVVDLLRRIALYARDRHQRHLIFVMGVPGSGKTLAGLQLVHDHTLVPGRRNEAVYLSRNTPLVTVLQHQLRSTLFVQGMHGFLKEYGGHSTRLPREHVWVYDEGQRALDAPRVQQRRDVAVSEPEDFIRLGDRMAGWACVVVLVGEGQEIYYHEPGGVELWSAALTRSQSPWIVHGPARYMHKIRGARRIYPRPQLDLTTSLRSHLAADTHLWVRQFLDGQIGMAARTAARLQAQGFEMYLAKNSEAATDYVRERYAGRPEKRYGILQSSQSLWMKARNARRYTSNPAFYATGGAHATEFDPVAWFCGPSDSPDSCCAMEQGASEFDCQGLELDFAFVQWQGGLYWRDGRWETSTTTTEGDDRQMRINSYRVLLTRARDGFIIGVPAHYKTYGLFASSGLRELR